jgi:hypothetical protein
VIPRPIAVLPHPRDWTDGSRPLSQAAAFVLVATTVILAFYVYYAQYSAAVRWILGVIGIAAFAILAWSMIVRRTAEPPPLVGPRSRDVVQEGDLGFLAAAVKRASHGLPYSQVQLVSRVRAAFVERAALALGISAEAMSVIQRDPAELHRILDDPVLERFVYTQVGDLEDRSRWIREGRTGDRFPAEIEEILARMEAWR